MANNLLGKEPAVILGALSEVVRAVIPTLIIFGFVRWTPEQVAQLVLLVGVVIGALNVSLTRAQTTATPAVDALIKTALTLPSTTTVEAVKTEQAAKDANLK